MSQLKGTYHGNAIWLLPFLGQAQPKLCKVCASSLQWMRDDSPGSRVAAGSLDTDLDIKPTTQIFCESVRNWRELRTDLPRVDRLP